MPRGLIARGNRRVVFQAPNLRPRADQGGTRVARTPRSITTRARFHPGAGSESADAAGIERGRSTGRWEVRAAVVKGVTTKWTLTHDGQTYGISAILPSTRGRGRSHVDVFTEVVE